jgi:hypothetical protein
MSTNQDNQDQEQNQEQSGNNDSKTTDQSPDQSGAETSTLIEKEVEKRLAGLKEKLDKAYKLRDDEKKRADKLEDERRAAELARLQEEGKHKEAFDMQMEDLKKKNEALERRNTELSRDNVVRDALRGLEFRSKKASDVALREVTEQLVQDDSGKWVHRSGVSIETFIESYSNDAEQSFLFKTKQNSGGGSRDGDNADTSSRKPKSLFARSQEEVLRMAEEGKL